MMKQNILLDNYRIEELNSAHTTQIQNLCDKCFDYYMLENGTGKNHNAAKDILEKLPPNKTFEDQYNWGLFDENKELVALINIIDGYPEDGVWMLGLLLVDPNKRRTGVGRLFHQEIVDFAKSNGGSKIRIAVYDDNTIAIRFWKSLGYAFEKETKVDVGPDRTKTVLVYSLII